MKIIWRVFYNLIEPCELISEDRRHIIVILDGKQREFLRTIKHMSFHKSFNEAKQHRLNQLNKMIDEIRMKIDKWHEREKSDPMVWPMSRERINFHNDVINVIKEDIQRVERMSEKNFKRSKI